jgi:DNA-binding NtrC family response regulator
VAVETVLVVEDEESVRSFVRVALETDGYSVVEAAGPDEALDAVRRYPGPIDLVLTDVILPRIRGNELVPLLLARRPGMRALYMSGFLADVPAGEVAPLLQKPFTLAALSAAVRTALGSQIKAA